MHFFSLRFINVKLKFSFRLRAPTPFGANAAPWPIKTDNFYEREQREHEEREKREREERERREREERERREREERERREREERERREREERERERERERRAEHEKERVARSIEASQERNAIRRDSSRSPLRPEHKDVSSLSAVPHPGMVHPHGPPGIPSLHSGATLKTEIRTDSKSDSRPSSRPGSRPGSRPTDSRIKTEKDDVVIVGSKEAPPRHSAHMQMPPTHPAVSIGMGMSSGQLLPPHSLPVTVSSGLDRARYLSSGNYQHGMHPHVSPWSDPYRDPFRAAAVHDPLSSISAVRAHEHAMRESLMAREVLRDPLRSSLDRAREEQFLRGNPLGSLILGERYREHQAREMLERERERQYVGAAAAASMTPGLYPPSSSMLPPPAPHMGSSLVPPGLKGNSPLAPHHAQLGGPPGLHQGITGLHPGAVPGHPSLGPGLPPPLIPSMRGSPSQLRPTDKKDGPR